MRSAPLLPPYKWFDERAQEIFGVKPQWLAGTRIIEEALRSFGAEVQKAVIPRSDATILSVELGKAETGRPPVIGIPLPAPADNVKWQVELLKEALPSPDVASVVLYDARGYLEKNEFNTLGLRVLRGDECTADEFLSQVDVLAIDIQQHALLSNADWIWKGLASGVVVAGPRHVAMEFEGLVTSFLAGGSRDLLTLLAIDEVLRSERCAAARKYAEGFPKPRLLPL